MAATRRYRRSILRGATESGSTGPKLRAVPVMARRSAGIAASFGRYAGRPDRYDWSKTKPQPWTVRAETRRRNARARRSRKANRGR